MSLMLKAVLARAVAVFPVFNSSFSSFNLLRTLMINCLFNIVYWNVWDLTYSRLTVFLELRCFNSKSAQSLKKEVLSHKVWYIIGTQGIILNN
jgi:hypothetical protein